MNIRITRILRVNSLITILFFFQLAFLTVFQLSGASKLKSAGYSVPEISGTGTIEDRKEMGGAYFPLQIVTIQTNSSESELVLKWKNVTSRT